MKKLMVYLLALAQCGVMSASKAKANPADYTVTVHVVFSRLSRTRMSQELETVVDGQPMEMEGSAMTLLLPGNYKARQLGMKSWDKKIANDYEVAPTYELLFDDGTTRKYEVIGMGIKGGGFIPPPDQGKQ